MSESVKEITEVVKDSKVAGEVITNISDQVNSVINNFASKLEAPAEAVQNVAKYGFEKYAENVSAYAIGSLVVDGIMIILSGIFAFVIYKIICDLRKAELEDTLDWDEFTSIVKAALSLILTIAFFIYISLSLSDIPRDLGKALAPEGAVVKEIIENVSKETR